MLADFTPVSLLSTVPMIVDVPANSRFKTWAELLAAAKAAPGTISVGHAGKGTPNHTDILRLPENEKVSFNIVPYRGSGVGLNDVLAGQIDAYVDQLSSSLPHLQSGKLRALHDEAARQAAYGQFRDDLARAARLATRRAA